MAKAEGLGTRSLVRRVSDLLALSFLFHVFTKGSLLAYNEFSSYSLCWDMRSGADQVILLFSNPSHISSLGKTSSLLFCLVFVGHAPLNLRSVCFVPSPQPILCCVFSSSKASTPGQTHTHCVHLLVAWWLAHRVWTIFEARTAPPCRWSASLLALISFTSHSPPSLPAAR